MEGSVNVNLIRPSPNYVFKWVVGWGDVIQHVHVVVCGGDSLRDYM